MKTIGMLMVMLGIIALIYGGIGYSRSRTSHGMDGMNGMNNTEVMGVTVTERHNSPAPLVLGLVVLVGGVALLAAKRRRV